jgi:hypothetical protein
MARLQRHTLQFDSRSIEHKRTDLERPKDSAASRHENHFAAMRQQNANDK